MQPRRVGRLVSFGKLRGFGDRFRIQYRPLLSFLSTTTYDSNKVVRYEPGKVVLYVVR